MLSAAPVHAFSGSTIRYICRSVTKTLLQARRIGQAGSRKPRVPVQEVPDGEFSGLCNTPNHMVACPFDSTTSPCAGSIVHILSIVQCFESKISAPRKPTGGVDEAVRGWCDARIMDHDSGVLVWVASALSRDGVFLVGHRFSHENVAVLNHGRGVPEDEVYALEAAAIEHRVVGAGPERNRLVFLGSGRVLEADTASLMVLYCPDPSLATTMLAFASCRTPEPTPEIPCRRPVIAGLSTAQN
nr:Os01g0312600 [Ipomoea batatas]